ncbi:MAG: DNA recombination protein RmuC [Spirochaetes bacterium]|jgi:DNA recombination protein RmuC|nr:DNA recombination protein RmuC [Spirochaetota bacterium]
MLESVLTPQVVAAFALGIILVLLLMLLVVLLRRRREPTGDEAGVLSRLEDVSRSLSELEQVFSVPQSRGAVGETLLSRLLEDWLPKGTYELQYSFREGTRVDAVVKLGRYMVPVDAKFPFEAAKRAMEKEAGGSRTGAGRAGGGSRGAGSRGGSRGAGGARGELRAAFMRHVNDIAERYIRPDEGTLGFALMYIPSERVYQFVFVDQGDDLLGEAMGRGVVPVSPSTLFLYLQTVAYGLRGFAISKDARALLSRFTAARTAGAELAKALSVAQTHLKNLHKSLSEVDDRVERLTQKLDVSQDEETG